MILDPRSDPAGHFEGQVGSRRGVGEGLTVGLADRGGVGEARLRIVRRHLPGEPQRIAAGLGVHVEPLLDAPRPEGLVARVQGPAVCEGFTDLAPQEALLGSGGLQAGPGAAAAGEGGGGLTG